MQFTARNGLSENKVVAAIRDLRGLYWFATAGEINRFDGYQFTAFPLKPSQPDIPQMAVADVLRRNDGNFIPVFNAFEKLYTGVFDPYSGQYTTVRLSEKLPAGATCRDLLSDRAGNMYGVIRESDNSFLLYRFDADFNAQKVAVLDAAISVYNYHSGIFRSFAILPRPDNCWYFSPNKGLVLSAYNNFSPKTYTHYFDGERPLPLEQYNRAYLHEDVLGNIWAIPWGLQQLLRYDPASDRWIKYSDLPAAFYTINSDQYGNLIFKLGQNQPEPWHIALFQPDKKQWTDLHNLWQHQMLNCIIGERFTEAFFLCTPEGIRHIRFPTARLKSWLNRRDFTPLQHAEVPITPIRGIVEIPGGDVVVATEAKGYFLITKSSNEAELLRFRYESNGQLAMYGDQTGRLYYDEQGYLWGIYGSRKSLQRFDLINNTVKDYPQNYAIYDFLPVGNGDFLMAGAYSRLSNGLYLYHPVSNTTEPLLSTEKDPFLYNNVIRVLYRSSNGNIWIGTENGLFCYDLGHRVLIKNPGTEIYRQHSVHCLHEDPIDKSLWIGTSDGLFHYSPRTGQSEHFNQSNGLPNDKIAAIIPDGENLWISTYFGLSYFNSQRKTFSNYFQEDGFCHNEFNRFAAMRASDGRFWFGTLDGVTAFRPEELLRKQKTEHEHKIFPIEFVYTAGNKQVRHSANLDALQEVVIPAQSRSCSFRFALNEFSDPQNCQYAYKLIPVDKEWHYTGFDPSISFNWLEAGRYTLQVKGADSFGNWSDPYSIELVVQEHFFKTWWFIALLLAFTLGVSGTFHRLRQRNMRTKKETERLRELDEIKTRLYANITHEFRTPLTLILGNAAQGLKNPEQPGDFHIEKYRHIQHSGNHLLQLVNQILDLRKLEAGKMKPEWVQGDIIVALQYIAKSFFSAANEKKIQLDFSSGVSGFVMDYDHDKLFSIIGNLLSNALKFTPPGGRISLRAELHEIPSQLGRHAGQQLTIAVSDNGPGIPAEELDKIFERFYQVDHGAQGGSGIGLTLVKELTQLLGGEVKVESTPGKGAVFTVGLPVHTYAGMPAPYYDAENLPRAYVTSDDSPSPDSQSNPLDPEAPLVLLVEDQPDLARFIANCLVDRWRVEFAANGREGLAKAIELVPDIIVSDVMMPEMNGLTMLQQLKTDTRTSHVPVVMLSARTDISDKLAGLTRGAQAYLGKPFNEDELRLTLQNLLQWRELLSRRYKPVLANSSEMLPGHDEEPEQQQAFALVDLNTEDHFVQQVMQYIESRLSDSELSIEDISRSFGMSYRQMHRKLQALTGVSPNLLIRAVRLMHARRLLRENPEMNITEIAYQTGFSSLAYFSRVFHKEFGISPTDVRNS